MDKLTLGGFEVEEILEIEKKNKKQIVLDISATANRADSLSIKGMAKEMKGFLYSTHKDGMDQLGGTFLFFQLHNILQADYYQALPE